MDAKDYLNQPCELQKLIRIKEQKARYYKELALSISSPGFEEHYTASRNIEAPFAQYLQKADALKDEIRKDYLKLAKLKAELDVAIDQVDDKAEAMILRYKYVMLLPMKEIASIMHYTLRWTQMIHVRAVTHFEILHPTSP